MLKQLLQIFIGDAILGQDVKQDHAQLVFFLNVLVKQNGDDVLHVVLDLLTYLGNMKKIMHTTVYTRKEKKTKFSNQNLSH